MPIAEHQAPAAAARQQRRCTASLSGPPPAAYVLQEKAAEHHRFPVTLLWRGKVHNAEAQGEFVYRLRGNWQSTFPSPALVVQVLQRSVLGRCSLQASSKWAGCAVRWSSGPPRTVVLPAQHQRETGLRRPPVTLPGGRQFC